MTNDDFWDLIHRSANERDRAAWLTDRLAQRDRAQIVEFELRLAAERRCVDTYLMWGAASLLMEGWCSDDGFWYFQPWLVGLGRDAFERVAAQPDALAELPQVRRLAGRAMSQWSDDEWPQWESLDYVALNAYRDVTGEEDGLDEVLEARGHPRVCDAAPDDAPWDYGDPAERRARLPRLAGLFG